MKEKIAEIKKFVNDRFNPQGFTIDVDYCSDSEGAFISLTPGEENRTHFNWGRTLIALREKFPAPISFSMDEMCVNDDKFVTPIINFRLP